MPGDGTLRYWAPQAWVQGRWAYNVLLTVDAAGRWQSVDPDTAPAGREDAVVLGGPVLPGLVDAHSHAFQRAIAGLTERSPDQQDDFWSWRDRMYSAANRITPEQLQAIAAQLYAELLHAGYTHVCEFHYLHNAVDGQPYADADEMSLALARAAQSVGIGLTLLPTLYMRAGFAKSGLREDQRRFASTPDSVLRIAERIAREFDAGSGINAGVALHSLRAVDEAALAEVAAATLARGLPVHIHVAEQMQEVDDCIAHHGLRPIEWLLRHARMDARWNLVHATQSTPAELQGVRESGASIVICPSTEANLGDGVFDLPTYARQLGSWSIGSDSHVTRSWQEELRLLEYSQRLHLRQRNIAARAGIQESTAAMLFDAAVAGGAPATGQAVGAIAAGRRADFMVVDATAPALLGIPSGHVLDALVFSSPDARMQAVYLAGRQAAPYAQAGARTDAFVGAMQALWG
jgi:formimidoylglutamate deiminase